MDELSEYEKKRLANIKENNEILKSLGLLVNKPSTFDNRKKRKRKGRKRRSSSSCSSSEDEEWIPGVEETAVTKCTRKVPVLKPEVRKPLTRVISQANKKLTTVLLNKEPRLPRKCKKGPRTVPVQVSSCDLPYWLQSDDETGEEFEGFSLEEVLNDIPVLSEEKKEKEECKLFYEEFGESDDEYSEFDGFEIDEINIIEGTGPISEVEERRYPRRKVTEDIKYTEEDLSDEDEYLFCEDCEEIHHGDCPVHGPLLTLDPSSGYNEVSTQYTTVPVPKELTVKPSKISDAGLGVYATQSLPKGMRFGPYKGQKVYGEDLNEGDDTSYMWEIKRGGESYYIDGQVESESNWMRFINCARNEEEQNLVAFQYHGDIYYRSFKHIHPGDELYVWYGDQYAKELGISTAFNKDGDLQPFVCKNCGSSFVARLSFNIHLRHNKRCSDAHPQLFTCQICQDSFSKLHQLQDHIREHEDQGQTSTIEHMNNTIEDCGKICSYCGKEFPSRSDLQRHIRTHTGEKPYQCKYCYKRFNQDIHLKQHVRIHTGDKPYKCQYCGKAFNQDNSLKQHVRIHTGDKPYKCQYCEKAFSVNNSLKLHLRIHTGDKPYKCQYCEKAFTCDSNLKLHVRIHTGDKPYKCQYCGKAFTQSHHLKSHKCIPH